METPQDLITATEARRLLGVSPLKMAQLLREGVLPHFPDPLNKRRKLVSKTAALALKMPRAEAA